MERKIKILFTSTIFATFVKEDLAILEKQYNVEKIVGKGVPFLIKSILAIFRCDVTFTWFASVYSAFIVFFSRLSGKKSIIVIGGVDVAKEPSINYGIWLSWWKSIFVGYALRNADKVLAVDPFLISEAKRLAKFDGGNLIYSPFGFSQDFWKPLGEKEKFILSVGVCEDEWRMMKKGFDKLIQAALLLPHVNFKIVGIKNDFLIKIKNSIPKNVELISFLDQDTLLKYYQKAKVYCQVSYHEGLPNTLCEAMLCECIPVGTNRSGIPTAIGDVGIIIPYGDIDAMVKAFSLAIELPEETGKKARQRIIENFPSERRQRELASIIDSLLK